MTDDNLTTDLLSVWPETSAQDAEALRARLAGLLHDWENGFDAGAAHYTRDERAHIWDGTPVPAPGVTAYERQTRPWMDTVASLTNTIEEVQVLRAPEGGLAVTVTFLGSSGRMQDGSLFSAHMRETLVWAQSGDRWRVVHEHTSPVPEAAS